MGQRTHFQDTGLVRGSAAAERDKLGDEAALLGQDAEEGLASASKSAEETGASIGEMEASVDTHRYAALPVMLRLAARKVMDVLRTERPSGSHKSILLCCAVGPLHVVSSFSDAVQPQIGRPMLS